MRDRRALLRDVFGVTPNGSFYLALWVFGCRGLPAVAHAHVLPALYSFGSGYSGSFWEGLPLGMAGFWLPWNQLYFLRV